MTTEAIDDYMKQLRRENEAMRSELSDYAKTVSRLRDELDRAKARIKELMEIHQ